MKKIILLLTATVLLLLFLPFLFSHGWTASLALNNSREKSLTEEVQVNVLIGDTVQSLPLTDYLCGAVAAEMPASYPEEALKAQAVAAYSYLAYRYESQKADPQSLPEHKGATVCDDPSHCKGYLSPEQTRLMWGEEGYSLYSERIKNAVTSVAEETVLYENKPANTVFHALSAGRTENAEDIWGVAVPYLTAVDSPGDKQSPDWKTQAIFEKEELFRLLSILRPSLSADLTVGEIERTGSGGVKSCVIGGETFSGVEMRSTLSLRSIHFDIAEEDGRYCFEVLGAGHLVGMSQYGARAMAEEGADARAILAHYYPGTTIGTYKME